MTLRQIHFATVDLELHSRFKPGQVGGCTGVASCASTSASLVAARVVRTEKEASL